MNQQYPTGDTHGSNGAAKKPGYNSSNASKTPGKDYIEFEEIK